MRIVVVGEGMLELSTARGGCRLGYGGDILNSAIHMARFGRSVAFATALGADPFSEELRAAWQREGLDTSLVLTDPTRLPGLYAIRTDAAGERSFTYWRGESAARRMFSLEKSDRLVAEAGTAGLLLFSLISLAVLPPAGREALMAICARVRAGGGRVAFDGNYRPALWPDADSARAARDLAISHCDIGLPTLEDEAALRPGIDAAGVAAHWGSGGAEVVVKLGPRGCLVDGAMVPPPATLSPVDTSGAGDAFNAGYLNGRIAGQAPADAARAGHALAGWTLMRAGAVPPVDAEAPYLGGTR